MKWSLYIGRVSGIGIFIHWTFVFLLLYVSFAYYQVEQSLTYVALAMLFTLALFVCVTLHELGHALTAQRFQISTRRITLLPIGGLALMEKIPEKPSEELQVAIAGPLVNLVIAVLLFFILAAINYLPDFTAVDQWSELRGAGFWFNLFLANVMLFVFNLIPAFPMDGGRIFRSLLAFKFSRDKATRIAARLGQFIAVWFIFVGFFGNFWLVFIGLFIYLGATTESAFASTKHHLEGHFVREAMLTQYEFISPSATFEDAMTRFLNGQDELLVVQEMNRIIGVLQRTKLIRALPNQGRDTPIMEIVDTSLLELSPTAELPDAYQNLLSQNPPIALVKENDQLIGLIDQRRIAEWSTLLKKKERDESRHI